MPLIIFPQWHAFECYVGDNGATWRSGDAADCKSVYASSILAVASSVSIIYSQINDLSRFGFRTSCMPMPEFGDDLNAMAIGFLSPDAYNMPKKVRN